jgi:hypothetical protein
VVADPVHRVVSAVDDAADARRQFRELLVASLVAIGTQAPARFRSPR